MRRLVWIVVLAVGGIIANAPVRAALDKSVPPVKADKLPKVRSNTLPGPLPQTPKQPPLTRPPNAAQSTDTAKPSTTTVTTTGTPPVPKRHHIFKLAPPPLPTRQLTPLSPRPAISGSSTIQPIRPVE